MQQLEAEPRAANDPFDALVRAHQGPLWRFLRVLGCSAVDADELAVEAFVVAYQRGFVSQGHAQAASYLRQTAKNLWLQQQRRLSRDEERFAEVVQDLWNRTCPDGGTEYLEALRSCVSGLRGRAAEAIRLTYLEGVPQHDVAGRLGLRPNGLKTLLQRARGSLRRCVERTIR